MLNQLYSRKYSLLLYTVHSLIIKLFIAVQHHLSSYQRVQFALVMIMISSVALNGNF